LEEHPRKRGGREAKKKKTNSLVEKNRIEEHNLAEVMQEIARGGSKNTGQNVQQGGRPEEKKTTTQWTNDLRVDITKKNHRIKK